MHCAYCKRKCESGDKICSKCGKEIFPIAVAEELPYKIVPPHVADELKDGKVDLFAKGGKKKIIASIKNGTCGIVKVRVEKSGKMPVSEGEDSMTLVTVYDIQTLNKHPISVSVEAIYDFSPQEMTEAYLFRIKIKKDSRYYLLPTEDYGYLSENIGRLAYIEGSHHSESRNRDIFDGAIDKIGQAFSGLFGKK